MNNDNNMESKFETNTSSTQTHFSSNSDETIVADDAFSYNGYQVVRGEFFAHLYEPSITFNNCRVSVNTACIRK